MSLRRLAKWMAGAIGLLMVLSCVGGLFEPAVLAVLYVCFGWIGFLRHILPHVTVNWEGVATAAGCLIAVVAGAQWFLNWLWSNAPRVDNIDRPAWQPRWTAALIASVLLMFASGLCVVGAAHQTAWLVTSKEDDHDY